MSALTGDLGDLTFRAVPTPTNPRPRLHDVLRELEALLGEHVSPAKVEETADGVFFDLTGAQAKALQQALPTKEGGHTVEVATALPEALFGLGQVFRGFGGGGGGRGGGRGGQGQRRFAREQYGGGRGGGRGDRFERDDRGRGASGRYERRGREGGEQDMRGGERSYGGRQERGRSSRYGEREDFTSGEGEEGSGYRRQKSRY